MAFTLFLLLAISTHLCFSQIVTGSHGSMPHEYNAIMERFQLRGNRTDHILRRPSNMQCITHSEEDRLDCDEDWKDRLEDDLNDREECCAFVRYRNCIKEAFEVSITPKYRTANNFINFELIRTRTHVQKVMSKFNMNCGEMLQMSNIPF